MNLRIDSLSVVRGGRLIVEDLSLSVRAGTFLAVAGPNRTGKSSLLRSLSGELAPAAGRVCYGDRELADFDERELAARRSFLAQQTECRLPFAVEDIVRLGAEAAGLRGRSVGDAISRAMERAGVARLAGRIVSHLSGGEQQRVHWARVLAQIGPQPGGHLLFLDEPVSSLDPEHQHRLLSAARKLTRQGATVLAVLHDLGLAARYADEILLLHQGRMVARGTPWNVLTEERIALVFGVACVVVENPLDGTPLVIVDFDAAEKRRDNDRIALRRLC